MSYFTLKFSPRISIVVVKIEPNKSFTVFIIKDGFTFGNYNYTHEPEIPFAPGEIVLFSCPECKKHVHSEKYKNYAVLKMHVSEKIIFDVLFTREAGKRRTYIVTEDGIESYSEK